MCAMSVATPPRAERRPTRLEMHGHVRMDEYYWLRERTDPAVIAHLDAENRYQEAILQETAELQRQLVAEMRGRIQETDQSVPVQIDDYFYYSRTVEGEQYSIHCRKQGSMEADEEILLDVNALAADHDYTRVGIFDVSPDHRLLAFSVDQKGNERYTIHVKDLVTGELLPDRIDNCYYGLAWLNDSSGFYYTTLDPATRPHQLWRHRLGQSAAQDQQLFHEEDERFFLWIHKSKSQAYVFMHLGSKLTDEVWWLDAADPHAEPQVIQPRIHGLEYAVEHHGDSFYLVTNWDAQDFRIMRTPVDRTERDHWREVLPHRPGVKIDRVEPFRTYMVIHLRAGGLRRLRVIPMDGDPEWAEAGHEIALPEPVFSIRGTENPVYAGDTFRFVYTSLTTPPTTYDYGMADRRLTVRKVEPVLGDYAADEYVSTRLWAQAADGTQVPISLVHHKDVTCDGANPTLLYGYGSYGASMDPTFNANRISLLQRGFVFAIAHVRGGGELGRAWYDAGKLMAKKNTFTDFIACAEHLMAAGYTRPEKLVAMGRSAGGLLMGAVVNMRPDLFQAVVAGVPFVDVVSTMADPSIPLTVTEYEEWGNPADPAAYDYLRSYSPYDNLENKVYPHILATAGLNDPRVQYWEPAKWIAKLRTVQTGDNLLLLKTNMAAGHAGASGRYDYLDEIGLEYAFMIRMVGACD